MAEVIHGKIVAWRENRVVAGLTVPREVSIAKYTLFSRHYQAYGSSLPMPRHGFPIFS